MGRYHGTSCLSTAGKPFLGGSSSPNSTHSPCQLLCPRHKPPDSTSVSFVCVSCASLGKISVFIGPRYPWSHLWLRVSLSGRPFADLTDVTLANETQYQLMVSIEPWIRCLRSSSWFLSHWLLSRSKLLYRAFTV